MCAFYAGFVLAVDLNLEIKPTLKNQKIQKEIIKKIKEDHFFKVKNIEDISNIYQKKLIESLDPCTTLVLSCLVGSCQGGFRTMR